MPNPPVDVQQYGQSIWLDYIHRKDLQDGTLERRIKDHGILGLTSNPTIFDNAIGNSNDYDSAIAHLLELDPHDIYEILAVEDIQHASDLLRPIYERTEGKDGFVSLEVSPLIAESTEKTIEEARRLFGIVNRPNLMIKIPATPAGIPAIEEVIASGINVNVTLIFAVKNYIDVTEAFIRGLERRLEAGESVAHIASVASFFLSRIDALVDSILENNIRAAQVQSDTGRIAQNRKLLGQAAVANARLAYQRFHEIFFGPRFEKLLAAGAQVQRPLWASTGTKNPAYPDTKYVDSLIGAHTVNTLPPKTLDAFRDHGAAADTLSHPLEEYLDPKEVMDRLAEVEIDIDQITQRLQDDGVDSFIQSFESLMNKISAKRAVMRTGIMERQKLALGISAKAVDDTIKQMESNFINGRIWNRDGTVWKEHGPTIAKIKNRLGWLDVLTRIEIPRLKALQDSVRGSSIGHVVLLGMGGSSLAPEVLYQTFGRQAGFPELIVLDSTDPARVAQVEASIDLKNTLFIVASKSGSTVETSCFYRYFYQRTGQNGSQFIAITDPGSQVDEEATQNQFRDIFRNPADIGGRYSALSYFGMVPAALIGLDLDRLWDSARQMIDACNSLIPAAMHPGIILGTVMGKLGQEGRDKIAIFCSKSIATFGNWLEQLIAESIGKEGRGVIPVVGSSVGKPHDYGTDRLFIYLRVDDDEDVAELDEQVKILREAGHPRVTLRLPDAYALAGEFFRWEYATAVVGQVYGVNPFDEPNVTEAKEATKALLEQYQQKGSLPQSVPVMSQEGVSLYANEHTLAPLRELCRSHGYDSDRLIEVVAAQLVGTNAGDYFGMLVYFTPTAQQVATLEEIRRRMRHVTKRAVTLGYGPRYLHSTGQLHKGGANNGVFIQLTADLAPDLAIPDMPYSFGTLFNAQAAGDLQTLYAHKRRALRLHLSGDISAGLEKLMSVVHFVQERRQ